MDHSQDWFTAATLTAMLFAESLGLPARANPLDVSLAARRGAQFGLLVSASLPSVGPVTLSIAPDNGVPAPFDPASARGTIRALSVAPETGALIQQPAPSPDAGAPAASDALPPAEDDASAPAPSDDAAAPPPDAPAPTEVPPPAPTPVPDKGKLIFVDAGHGGAESGAVHTAPDGTEDLIERDVNLSIALRLADLLSADGYHVQLSRTGDYAVDAGGTVADLQARVDLANRVGADLFVSIHHNGSENQSLRGTEVYYCSARPYSGENQRLASLTQQALVNSLRAAGYDDADRGTKDDIVRGHLALLAPANLDRASQMPAIIGEALYMSNDADAAVLKRDDMRDAIARGYLEGIKAYFGDTGP